MSLPPSDMEFLSERELPHQIVADGNVTCVIFPAWRLPDGYDRASSDLLLRLMPGNRLDQLQGGHVTRRAGGGPARHHPA